MSLSSFMVCTFDFCIICDPNSSNHRPLWVTHSHVRGTMLLLILALHNTRKFGLQVRVFETHCGSLTQYGMKHMRAFANLCNKGKSKDEMEVACMEVCGGYIGGSWSLSNRGFSA